MTKINGFLIGLAIGYFVFSIYLIDENITIKRNNAQLQEDINYYKGQLSEIPTIIESRKGEICNEQN